MMHTNFLVSWIESAEVDSYKKENKQVYIATNESQQLILTCEEVLYPSQSRQSRIPHINVVWIDNGKSEILHQDIIKNGYNIHSTGNIEGDFGPRENVETIYVALITKGKFMSLYPAQVINILAKHFNVIRSSDEKMDLARKILEDKDVEESVLKMVVDLLCESKDYNEFVNFLPKGGLS